MGEPDHQALAAFTRHYDAAELYHAYAIVQQAAQQPFRTVHDATLFNAARCAGARAVGCPRCVLCTPDALSPCCC